jgi:hypothetical protein
MSFRTKNMGKNMSFRLTRCCVIEARQGEANRQPAKLETVLLKSIFIAVLFYLFLCCVVLCSSVVVDATTSFVLTGSHSVSVSSLSSL